MNLLRLIIIPGVVLASGCASDRTRFDNRVVSTLAGDRAFALMLFGPVGVSLELAPADVAEIQRLRARSTAATPASVLVRP